MAAATSRNERQFGTLHNLHEPSDLANEDNLPQMPMPRQLTRCHCLPGLLSDPGAPGTPAPSEDPERTPGKVSTMVCRGESQKLMPLAQP